MENILKSVTERSIRYFGRLQEDNVIPSSAAIESLSKLDESLPEGPTDIESVIHLLDEIGSPATVLTTGGRYFGFVTGGSLPVALAANWLAGAWDQNAGLRVMSPIASVLEQIALGWLCDVLCLPAEAGGGFVSGATMANFTALAAARHALMQKQGWDVEAKGLFGAPPVSVVVGDEVHVSVLKALSLLGFGRERVIRVPVDEQGRLRADALSELTETTIVCIQAGNVNTGAFDPAVEICAAARNAG
ncbi:MAG: pyridoxal-dependent decarboxylase, partial [Desulfobacterales bacterium]|nr:pyridoxal-dependent decarboxylase [Desulfobacterales bacterium]